MNRSILFILTLVITASLHAAPVKIEFNRDVRPILSENCFACHGFDPKHREADLRLDTFEGATEDRDGSRGIVPGDLAKSDVWQRIITEDKDDLMPPEKSHKPPLNAKQREILKAWIEQGATYQRHWSFEPLMKSTALHPPTANPIDYYIAKKLEQNGLSPSTAADATTLIRRVSLDLTGLPPTPSEVDAFVKASAKNADAAYRALVDRLLKSPHYGERWGRWWLDQARYADSNGYSIDAPRQIWKFRDWVVNALNKNMPFDEFTIEQLAGDLLPNAKESQIIATGFHRNTQINQEGGIDKEQFRIDSVFDRVATTGSVWLGLSIGCAQCHDHKFDPIEQKEYYRMFAFLNNQDEPEMKVFDPKVDVKALTAEFKDVTKRLTTLITDRYAEETAWEKDMAPDFRAKLSAEVKKAVAKPVAKRSLADNVVIFSVFTQPSDPLRILNDRYKELDTLLNKGTTTMVLKELPKPRKTTVFIKGDFTRPADEVTPGTPKVLHAFETTNPQPNRLDLAKWIVSPQNPLTARVIVNRVWQQYFGRGIVETENDFGSQGTLPSHPELLDWLAKEFLAKKWSLKQLHRLIVTSHTYRQSSANRPELIEKDPNNYLLARQTRLRLDAEIVRDVCLTASGLLSPKIGGPPVYPPIPDGVMGQGQVKRVWTVSKGEDKYRRGLYTFVYRASPPPELTVFDAPEGFNSCTRRIRSNTPLQALTLMNDPGFYEFAGALEQIIKKEGLAAAFKRCTARAPKPEELAVLKKLDSLNAARTLLNLDETVTRE
ncbi:PSD1 and planctomycete cytochrome C domain-containing protein [Prosthecobacter sp.]|uniref:PSD1 and planctomycete cytochrome C domain-containing protein n=1 Tax=Prosthecobacter sp. TaxID=1965333 RepID=UPI001DBB7D69|nr:PSD1 and planctomycete cytochrome C domain-containing protein [Prosthecobacter sp.]MCB1275018.1 PSD1 domain-containing protein [Prosthecobacter sp.]